MISRPQTCDLPAASSNAYVLSEHLALQASPRSFSISDLDDLLTGASQPALVCCENNLFYANEAARMLFGLPADYSRIHLNRILPMRLRTYGETRNAKPNNERRLANQYRTERACSLDGSSMILEFSISNIIVNENSDASLLFFRALSPEHTANYVDRERLVRLHSFVSFAPLGIFYLDARLNCEYVNDSWCRMTGLSIQESMGQGWIRAFGRHDTSGFMHDIYACSAQGQTLELQLEIETPLGKRRWVMLKSHLIRSVELSNLGIAGTIQDIDDLVKAKQSLQNLADHDNLTGLPNRQLFINTLKQAILRTNRQRGLGLLYIDLNYFKQVNDSCGHTIGDEYLKICAARFKASLREEDFIARIGGDEFTVLVENIKEHEDLSAIAEKIISNLSAPMLLAGKTFQAGAAIGIAITNTINTEPNVFISQADEAMYVAKQEEGSCFRFHSDNQNKRADLRASIARGLSEALDNNSLSIWFQSLHRLDDDKQIGYEALMRWNPDGNGYVPPCQFIPVLESSGLIHPATRWLLEQVVTFIHHERIKPGRENLQVSFNLSARSVRDKDFIPHLQQLLTQFPLARTGLICEITESLMLNDLDRACGFIDNLKKEGIMVALDDFGTGYCSLQYLRKFPIDRLKIDGSFVRGMADREEDRTIVKTIVDLAHNLKMCVVAEGVETAEQRQALLALNCDYYQGYLTGLPPESAPN